MVRHDATHMDDENELLDIVRYFVDRYGPAAAALMDSRATACDQEGDAEAGRLWRGVAAAMRKVHPSENEQAQDDLAAGSRAKPATVPDRHLRIAFEAAPHPYLLLTSDLRIAAANDAFLEVMLTRRADIVGRGVFEALPDNPSWEDADGVRNLGASLARVVEQGRPDRMAIQRHDVKRPDGVFEERWWSALNTPAFDETGRLVMIIHHPQELKAGGRGRA